MEDEKRKLLTVDPLIIIDYIKQSIEILLSLKTEESPSSQITSPLEHRSPKTFEHKKSCSITSAASAKEGTWSVGGALNEYEAMLQKLEADIRNHIRIEQQLKLHIESLQGKIDENDGVITDIKVDYRAKLNVRASPVSSCQRKRKRTSSDWRSCSRCATRRSRSKRARSQCATARSTSSRRR